jgi:hypothetical protein
MHIATCEVPSFKKPLQLVEASQQIIRFITVILWFHKSKFIFFLESTLMLRNFWYQEDENMRCIISEI